jgi:hypothetical protein
MEKDNYSNEMTDAEQDAIIIPFRSRLQRDLAKAMLRHPASGLESIEATLRRLNDETSEVNVSEDE